MTSRPECSFNSSYLESSPSPSPGAPRTGGTWGAGREVLALATYYIARLRLPDLRRKHAGYVIQSIKRDLGDARRRYRARPDRLALADTVDGAHDRIVSSPSAEEAALSGPVIKAKLADAVRRGALSDEAAQIVWLCAEGHSLTVAANNAGISVSQAYRLHARALAVVRRELGEAS